LSKELALELFSLEFFSALAAIVVIDLVLAGDNAIVIALAARNVPPHLQRRAMVFGAGTAVVLRSAMTMAAVWLLQIPGLLFAGGALLVWIAYKLLLPESGNGKGSAIAGASTFWGAIRTIVIADVVMGVDNVLGVAGAAHGSFALVVFGLLVSIPILICGSGMLLRFVERFPGFVYVGAGVLALTAAKMISAEPYAKEFFAAHDAAELLLYLATVGGVLWAGVVQNHRRLESEINARLSGFAQQRVDHAEVSQSSKGGSAMVRKILVPVDGSSVSNFVVPHIIHEHHKNRALKIHLLNVQPWFSTHIAWFASSENREVFHRERAERALAPARRALDAFGVPYTVHVEVGNKGEIIAETAQRLGCDHIVMTSARRRNSLTRMFQDSVTHKVLKSTNIPLEVVAADAVSNIERYGVPAGLAALLGSLFLAAAD
jgi:YjbE family integral membrane protein